jgi:hypothetical protein
LPPFSAAAERRSLRYHHLKLSLSSLSFQYYLGSYLRACAEQIFRKPYVLTGFDNDVQLAVMDEGKKQGIKYVVFI